MQHKYEKGVSKARGRIQLSQCTKEYPQWEWASPLTAQSPLASQTHHKTPHTNRRTYLRALCEVVVVAYNGQDRRPVS